MEKTAESATSNVKSTEPNTSNGTDSKKINTTPVNSVMPNVISLGLLFLSTIGIIIAGYFHGHMSIGAVYKNIHS